MSSQISETFLLLHLSLENPGQKTTFIKTAFITKSTETESLNE